MGPSSNHLYLSTEQALLRLSGKNNEACDETRKNPLVSMGHKSINIYHQKLDAIILEVLPCRDPSLIPSSYTPKDLVPFSDQLSYSLAYLTVWPLSPCNPFFALKRCPPSCCPCGLEIHPNGPNGLCLNNDKSPAIEPSSTESSSVPNGRRSPSWARREKSEALVTRVGLTQRRSDM